MVFVLHMGDCLGRGATGRQQEEQVYCQYVNAGLTKLDENVEVDSLYRISDVPTPQIVCFVATRIRRGQKH